RAVLRTARRAPSCAAPSGSGARHSKCLSTCRGTDRPEPCRPLEISYSGAACEDLRVYWRSTDHGGECSREHLTAPQVAHSRTQEEPMSSPIAMARFDRGWPLAGIWAAVVSIMVL